MPTWKHMMKKRKTNCQTFSPHQLYFIRQISVKHTHTHTHTNTHTHPHTPTHTHTHTNTHTYSGTGIYWLKYVTWMDIPSFFYSNTFSCSKKHPSSAADTSSFFSRNPKLDFKKYPEQKKMEKKFSDLARLVLVS